MIETPQAVAQAVEIAAVDGVDAVFVGPNDLSHSMSFGNDWKAHAVESAIERALRAITGAGTAVPESSRRGTKRSTRSGAPATVDS